jgi:hypothetical protein
MSSHREAPGISKDPVADSTDVYAFVSPDRPETVTIIANYVPLEAPAGGPNFYEFGNDVTYKINIWNHGKAGVPNIVYTFRFHTVVLDPNTFLYNTGRITSLSDKTFNRRQFFSVSRQVGNGREEMIADDLACPPCNIGPHSTPDYPNLVAEAIHRLPSGGTVFAGQRAEGFYVDLGAVFDLLDLRPFQNLHVYPMSPTGGVDTLATANVHTIALQVPITELTHGGRPTNPADPDAVVGVWTSAYRQKSRVMNSDGGWSEYGPWEQVSRLGDPLINEAIIPMGRKDEWNHRTPADDEDFVGYYEHPEVAGLLPVLYPGVFPHLAALKAPRADLVAALLTGLPAGIVKGFQNYTGPNRADMLRLNTAIHPAAHPSPLGLLGGDPAGFPNGRRVADDVFTIELRAIAGVTYPLVHPSYKPDKAATEVTDAAPAPRYLATFPYLNNPHAGFDVPKP